MKQTINGLDFARMIEAAYANIELNKELVNQLNVFPVPDGDTGTNMSLTMGAAAAEMQKLRQEHLGKAAEKTAGALLRGARGNSGVILSLLFRGFAKYLKDKPECDGFDFALALTDGVEAAYKAVMKPTEGTILTVSRVSAEYAAEAAKQNDEFEYVLEKTIEKSHVALAETLEQNPVLKKTGVVDAGGKGFTLILEGMLAALRGEELEAPQPQEHTAPKEAADFSEFDTGDITFGYCTEFIASRENDKDPELLRQLLSGMGDCLVLVDDDEIIKVHVHTNNPGIVLEEALKYGSLITVKVENMRLQHTEKVLSSEEKESSSHAEPTEAFGFVAVCAGDGVAQVFRDIGVSGIIQGGQTMNPSTDDILQEVYRTPAKVVYILPNNKNIIMAAEQCIPMVEDRQVVVVPTRTVPQGITAMLTFDAEADPDTNKAGMMEAAAGVTTMEVTYAARNSTFDDRDIHEGDYLSMINGQLFGNNTDIDLLMEELAKQAAEKDCGFVTIFCGEDVSEEQSEKAKTVFESACPGAEVCVINGGQPVYYFLISVE